MSCAQHITSIFTSIEDSLPFITSHCYILLLPNDLVLFLESGAEEEECLADTDLVVVFDVARFKFNIIAVDEGAVRGLLVGDRVLAGAEKDDSMLARDHLVADGDVAIHVAANNITAFIELEVDTHLVKGIGDQPTHEFACIAVAACHTTTEGIGLGFVEIATKDGLVGHSGSACTTGGDGRILIADNLRMVAATAKTTYDLGFVTIGAHGLRCTTTGIHVEGAATAATEDLGFATGHGSRGVA